MFSLRHDGATLLGITDTACAKAVTGTLWLQQYSDALKDIGLTPELVRESEAFKFGTGKIHHSSFHVVVCFKLGNKTVEMKTSVINGDVPLLMSKAALAQLGMVYDVAENTADFTRVGLRNFALITTSSGHPAIPILPTGPSDGPERLIIGETHVQNGAQYTAFALSRVSCSRGLSTSSCTTGPEDSTTKSTPIPRTTTPPSSTTSTTKAPPYKIFYDKKLSSEVKHLLIQDRLHEVSFMNWWEKTNINSDFWLEGECMWHRIHVVPRRALCNPSTWKTQHTVQRDMLIRSIGDLRITEGFCCKTGKPLETAADYWKRDCDEASFPLLWVGRSSFAKLRASSVPEALPRSAKHGMQTPSHLEDDQDGADQRMRAARACSPPELDMRGTESNHHGAQDERSDPEASFTHEVRHQPHASGAQGEGRRARGDVPGEGDEREPSPPHPRRQLDPGVRAHENREVQGVRVPGDTAPVRNVGCARGPNVCRSSCGAGALCQMVGGEGVRAPLRRPGIYRGERHRALPGRDHERGGIFHGGLGLGDGGEDPPQGPEPTSRPACGKGPTFRPEGDQAWCPLGRLPGDGGGGGPEHPRGDQGAGDKARGVEAEGEGWSGATKGRAVRFAEDSLDGKLAPTKEQDDREDTTLHYDYQQHEGPRRLLPDSAHRRGRLHPLPPGAVEPGDSYQQNYKHDGSHFGRKPIERFIGCCGEGHGAIAHGTFLTNEEIDRAAHHHETNYKCNPVTRDREDCFSAALREQDFTTDTLLKALSELDYDPVKAARDGALGGKTGDMVHYFTYGLFTHGGVVGLTTKTRENDQVARYLNAFAKHHLGSKATWTSISVSRDIETAIHHDFNNSRDTRNYTISVGQQSGGGLWLEDKSVTEDTLKNDVKWRRTATGQWLPGRVHDTKDRFFEFDPFLKHSTEQWTGTRWSVTYHTTRNIYKAGDEMRKILRRCGFPLPRKHAGGNDKSSSGGKPRASTRRTIFNNAAKIGVMLCTLISAAGSYLAEHVYPEVNADPVVMFEIGDYTATHEAVALGKDVFEPMTWERFRSPEGKDSAYHIVNGGGPRELRINLDGKQDECDEALLHLVRQQIHDGGTVVLTGTSGDSLLDYVFKDQSLQKTIQHRSDEGGRAFIVLFKEKEDTQQVVCRDRVHEVRMVSAAKREDVQSEVLMGATGITFGENTPKSVAVALRRLHQNLGHPRQEDLVRHLRLAGCDSSILKAARSMKCQVCDANAAPKIARPSTVPPMADFNDTLGLDLFFCHDTDDVKHGFLSVVDYGTTFHLAVRVDGQSAEDIEAKFNEMWLLPFGPPKAVVIDLEGGLQSALGRVCDWHGIGVRSVATQSHWQAGVVERQQAWWKHVWEKVSYQLSITEDEVDLAVPIINSSKNDLRRRCGYSPSQWVFGRTPRVPEDLQDPDGGSHVLWDVSEDAKYQRQSAMRAAARVAFHESQTEGRLRKALLQRTRVASRPLEIGESVHFWHKPKNRRRGCWSGPAVIVGKEGGNYWVSKGGRCRLTSAEHLRLTTAEEVGALLAMKGTQREVEKLLDHDPDGDEAFAEHDDLDYIDRMLDEEMSWAGEDPDVAAIDDDDELLLQPLIEDTEDPAPVPKRRLKRKTAAADLDSDKHEAMMLKAQLTPRGLEKRKEKELKWSEIPQEMHAKFREAEATQWQEHLSFDALEPLTTEESDRIRREVLPERVLRSRWAYKDKNWARRREGEEVPWNCKSRLVIAGHTDPDLTNDAMKLSTDAPTLSRCGLACMLQKTANGLGAEDPWTLSAGDIRCAFLTGSYLSRELYMHQPRTGFPGMLPGQLVRIKKNVFGLAIIPGGGTYRMASERSRRTSMSTAAS